MKQNKISIVVAKNEKLSKDLLFTMYSTPDLECSFDEKTQIWEITEKKEAKIREYNKELITHQRFYKRNHLGKPNAGTVSLEFVFEDGKKRYIDMNMNINGKGNIYASVSKTLKKLEKKIISILEEEKVCSEGRVYDAVSDSESVALF